MTLPSLHQRLQGELAVRLEKGLLRKLSVAGTDAEWLNLADNDYLELSRDPAVIAAARDAATRYGCSSSSSPLISGYGIPHRKLETELCLWHGFPSGLVWNSGYTANQALLSRLPRKDDIVFADRLIHNSMISGILGSGARLIRYRHNDVAHLADLLRRTGPTDGIHFVVTESVFSMDGDAPDLTAMVALKEQFPFVLIVDEAHATGWYGPDGSGLAAEAGVTREVDILVGTLGKALGSQGAYTLFHDATLREHLINHAGEFIYSTYLSPIAAAAGSAAIGRARELADDQQQWRSISRSFREMLRADGWEVPEGDSPIVPVLAGESEDALSLAAFLRDHKILAGAVRPPTVPAGSSRIRFSLKLGFTKPNAERVIRLLGEWRASDT